MALEKLIGCGCRHTIDYHDEYGCHARIASHPSTGCGCPLRPSEVVDRLIAVELEATRQRWFGNDPRTPLEDF